MLVAPSRPAVAARMLAGAQLVPVQVAPSRPVVGAALLRQVAEEEEASPLEGAGQGLP